MPSPFSFAVRRSELHSPEGTLSIEDKQQPVCSMCCSGWAESPAGRRGGERLYSWFIYLDSRRASWGLVRAEKVVVLGFSGI